MKRKGLYKPTVEDAIEIGGIETLHPGGFALTKRTAELAALREGLKVLDVSSGRGTQSIFYSKEFGVDVTGVDYSSKLKTIYVNGVYDNSGGTVGYTGTGNNFSLGYYPWASSHRLYGTMPASYFYSRELLPAEVAQNFNALRGRYGI